MIQKPANYSASIALGWLPTTQTHPTFMIVCMIGARSRTSDDDRTRHELQTGVIRNPNSCNSEPEVEAYELEKQYFFDVPQ